MIGEIREFKGKRVREVADEPGTCGCSECIFFNIDRSPQESVCKISDEFTSCISNVSHYIEVDEE